MADLIPLASHPTLLIFPSPVPMSAPPRLLKLCGARDGGMQCAASTCKKAHPAGRIAFPQQAATPRHLWADPAAAEVPGRAPGAGMSFRSHAPSSASVVAAPFAASMAGASAGAPSASPASSSAASGSALFLLDLDPALFVDRSAADQLTCAICLNVCHQPLSLPCSHLFCRACLTALPPSQRHCPECRVPFQLGACIVNAFAVKQIENMQMRCKHHNKGCAVTITLGKDGRTMHKHNDECRFVESQCDKCNRAMLREDLQAHREECGKPAAAAGSSLSHSSGGVQTQSNEQLAAMVATLLKRVEKVSTPHEAYATCDSCAPAVRSTDLFPHSSCSASVLNAARIGSRIAPQANRFPATPDGPSGRSHLGHVTGTL